MAQFTVNATRFDPYKNFKFRVKWDGQYVAGVSKVRRAEAHHRGGRSTARAAIPRPAASRPGRTEYDAITLERGVTHDTDVRDMGEQGLELRRGARRGGLARRTSARTSSSSSTTRPASSRSPTRSTAAGSRSTRRCPISTPTPTPSRSSTSSSRTRAGSATPTCRSRPSRASPDRGQRRWPTPPRCCTPGRARRRCRPRRGCCGSPGRRPRTCRWVPRWHRCWHGIAPGSARRCWALPSVRNAARGSMSRATWTRCWTPSFPSRACTRSIAREGGGAVPAAHARRPRRGGDGSGRGRGGAATARPLPDRRRPTMRRCASVWPRAWRNSIRSPTPSWPCSAKPAARASPARWIGRVPVARDRGAGAASVRAGACAGARLWLAGSRHPGDVAGAAAGLSRSDRRMSAHLRRLVARGRGTLPTVQPRVAARFETWPEPQAAMARRRYRRRCATGPGWPVPRRPSPPTRRRSAECRA